MKSVGHRHNYTRLTPFELEDLVADLLQAEGLSHVQKVGQNCLGFDLVAEELIEHKTGTSRLVKWAIQCMRLSETVGLPDLYTVPMSDMRGATHLLIVSATGFSSEAKRTIDRWKRLPPIEETVTWDAWRLSALLDKHKDVATKYFGVEDQVEGLTTLASGTQKLLESFSDILGEDPNIVDVSLLVKIEDNADSVWVLTPTLTEDTEIGAMWHAVETNLQMGKSYVYFVPIRKAVTEIRHVYVELFKKYPGRFHFVEIGSEQFGYPFQITIYDPRKAHRRAFLALEAEEVKNIELRPEATTDIVNTLQTRVARELPSYLEVSHTNMRGRPAKRLMVVLRTIGCLYGKCTMCGFRMMSASNVQASHLQKQIEHALATVASKLPEIRHVDVLGLGSFFDAKEVPTQAQISVLKTVAAVPSVERITVESRAEFITDSTLDRAVQAVASTELEVAVGVETSDDRLRNHVLRKGLPWRLLKAKMSVLARHNVGIVTYVLLKPPTLTEQEAVEDAVRTCHDLVEMASEAGVAIRLALEPAFVVSKTPLEDQFLRGEYKPMSLWTVADVVRAVHGLGEVFVGVSEEGLVNNMNVLGVESCAVPTSCRRCRSLFLGTLQEFNRTQDISVFERIRCGFCQDGWPQE